MQAGMLFCVKMAKTSTWVLPRFYGHLVKAHNGPGGVSWYKGGGFQEYKREAVTMLDAPGVSVSQIAAELGIGAAVLGRWRRELRQESAQAFRGNGRPRDENLALLRRELARVTKERDFLREAAAFFASASR